MLRVIAPPHYHITMLHKSKFSKLEFNPNIDRIISSERITDIVVAPPIVYKNEGLGQTDLNESFADDDSSNLFMFTLKSLIELKNVLAHFRILSGLSSNLEKSFLLLIGSLTGDVPPDILDLVFNFINKIKLLGFTLQNFGDVVASNFEQVTARIDNLTRFWERFFLKPLGRNHRLQNASNPPNKLRCNYVYANVEKINELV
jgi:hypothetical protein